MKKLFAVLLMSTTFSAFAQLPVIGHELTENGVKVEVSYDRYCYFFGPACVPYAYKWNKEVRCDSSNGKLVAHMNITRTVHADQVEVAESRIRKVKIKLEGLCNGRTPEGLEVNGVTIL